MFCLEFIANIQFLLLLIPCEMATGNVCLSTSKEFSSHSVIIRSTAITDMNVTLNTQTAVAVT